MELDSKFILSAQRVGPEILGSTPKFFVSQLSRTGVSPDPWEACQPVRCLVEDRDPFCDLVRSVRFRPEAVEEVFAAADKILAVLYGRPGMKQRLGDWQAHIAHAAAAEELLASTRWGVVIRTSNDRLAYWAQMARTHAPASCVFQYTDLDGVSEIISRRKAAA